jgi:hypothetical protein
MYLYVAQGDAKETLAFRVQFPYRWIAALEQSGVPVMERAPCRLRNWRGILNNYDSTLVICVEGLIAFLVGRWIEVSLHVLAFPLIIICIGFVNSIFIAIKGHS